MVDLHLTYANVKCYIVTDTAAVSMTMSIVSRIERFYRDVKMRRREKFGEEEPAFDTRYWIVKCSMDWSLSRFLGSSIAGGAPC